MKINSLIFRELVRRGYSLEGKTRIWNIADSKLWYLAPEQAKAYLTLVSSEDYKKKVGPKESVLLEEHLVALVDRLGKNPLNIIDLGCGNGKKAVRFLSELAKRKMPARYCPIDISGYMVKQAMSEVRKLGGTEIINVQWNISDFENLQNVVPLLKRDEYKHNFFLLLGNTFGNFETHELLYNVSNSMGANDMILIGNGLNNHRVEEDIVKSCRENPLRHDFFSLILKLIGLAEEDVSYGVRFRNNRLETFYTLLHDVSISLQDNRIDFTKGDQIVVAFAYHYEKEGLEDYLKMYFSNVKLYVSDDGSYALALCQK